MSKMKSVAQLAEYRAKLQAGRDPNQPQVLVCGGAGCDALGSAEVASAFREELRRRGLKGKVALKSTGCQGLCAKGVRVLLRPQEITYQQVSALNAGEIVEETLVKGKILDRFCYQDPGDGAIRGHKSKIPFYQGQSPLVLRHLDVIDPEEVDDYLAQGGYGALAQALSGMTPEEIIGAMERSGLRGRGGGGFPTGRKWRFLRQAPENPKFLICNGSEGDPGAYLDRAVMEGDPHAILEGMAIGALATGAAQGHIYVGHEYPLAVKRLRQAAAQARELGLLGKKILGTDFSFDLKVHWGGGAYVCGEETALMNFIEGNIGEPRNRPPYPAQKGLFGQPTVINNVETWANVPVIIDKGADWYAGVGTEKSKGSKVFSLAGAVNHSGLLEVPMGTPLRRVIFELGGGIKGKGDFKAVLTSGPGGGVIPAQFLDMPVTFENFQEAGGNLGSGSMVVMDHTCCMVDVAKYFVTFSYEESCGKCTPCREGTKQLLDILNQITGGQGEEEHLGLLAELGAVMSGASICGLGQSAPNPVLTTLKYFRAEYEAHIREKKCPALVCRPLLKYTVDPETCTGCLACVRECRVEAITGEYQEPQEIDQELCTKCGMCYEVCKFEAIKVES
jgi:NADH:ubiquinone oxidoreductase subunit F (NADH-binding)/(2Fe-2S) ferredoxin/NAD-dependent dihydropyrimidine dehydrogenase PreA subunit